MSFCLSVAKKAYHPNNGKGGDLNMYSFLTGALEQMQPSFLKPRPKQELDHDYLDESHEKNMITLSSSALFAPLPKIVQHFEILDHHLLMALLLQMRVAPHFFIQEMKATNHLENNSQLSQIKGYKQLVAAHKCVDLLIVIE